jgi:hypothetical protein
MVPIVPPVSSGAMRKVQVMEGEGIPPDQMLDGPTSDIAALAILDRAPDVQPDPGDEIL